jgi:hypothetical protein
MAVSQAQVIAEHSNDGRLRSVEVLSMKSWALAAIWISVGVLPACGSSETGGNGGGGGGSGGNGGATTTTTTTTSTSSGPVCDSNPEGCGDRENTGCYKCAVDGACKSYVEACRSDDECIALITCLDPCGENPDSDACIADCRTQSPQGATVYDAAIKCITCDECPNDCNAAEEPLCQQ